MSKLLACLLTIAAVSVGACGGDDAAPASSDRATLTSEEFAAISTGLRKEPPSCRGLSELQDESAISATLLPLCEALSAAFAQQGSEEACEGNESECAVQALRRNAEQMQPAVEAAKNARDKLETTLGAGACRDEIARDLDSVTALAASYEQLLSAKTPEDLAAAAAAAAPRGEPGDLERCKPNS